MTNGNSQVARMQNALATGSANKNLATGAVGGEDDFNIFTSEAVKRLKKKWEKLKDNFDGIYEFTDFCTSLVKDNPEDYTDEDAQLMDTMNHDYRFRQRVEDYLAADESTARKQGGLSKEVWDNDIVQDFLTSVTQDSGYIKHTSRTEQMDKVVMTVLKDTETDLAAEFLVSTFGKRVGWYSYDVGSTVDTERKREAKQKIADELAKFKKLKKDEAKED